MTRLKTSVVAKPTSSNVFIRVAGAASASPPPQCHQLHTSDKRDPWTCTHLNPGILTQRWILEHEYNVTGRAGRQSCTYRIILEHEYNVTGRAGRQRCTYRIILEHEYNVTGRAGRQRCTYRIILHICPTHTHTHTHTQLALLYTVTRNTTRIHYNINSTVQHIHQSVFICLLSHALRNFTLQPTRANRGTSASTAHSISAGGPG